jgi:hypothetical protein
VTKADLYRKPVQCACPGDGPSRGRFVQGTVRSRDGSSRGRFVLGTHRYKNRGDGPLRGRIVRGRIVRVPFLGKLDTECTLPRHCCAHRPSLLPDWLAWLAAACYWSTVPLPGLFQLSGRFSSGSGESGANHAFRKILHATKSFLLSVSFKERNLKNVFIKKKRSSQKRIRYLFSNLAIL